MRQNSMATEGDQVGKPEIYTRRVFLARTAAATTAIVAGGGLLAACRDDGPSNGAVTSPPDDPLAGVMSVRVHPAIGIARVGNSADSFFFGPELPGSLPVAPDGFKDASGAIARQAARFRIYGYDAAGERRSREITAADATHRVDGERRQHEGRLVRLRHGAGHPGRQARRSAATQRSPARPANDLVVASGEQSISGPAAAPVALDAGRFQGEQVPLGELMTDEQGRLVFLPGRGQRLLPRPGAADDVLRQRRLGRRHVRRAGAWRR